MLLALAGVLIVWEAAVDIGKIPRYVLPSPSDIWSAIGKHWQALLAHSWITLLETLVGFALSVGIGVPLAFLIVYSRIFDRVLYPILIASQAVPKVALAPILLIALGYSILPKVIVAFLIAFFPGGGEHGHRACFGRSRHAQPHAFDGRVEDGRVPESALSRMPCRA